MKLFFFCLGRGKTNSGARSDFAVGRKTYSRLDEDRGGGMAMKYVYTK